MINDSSHSGFLGRNPEANSENCPPICWCLEDEFHPLKTTMESPKNWWFSDVVPFPRWYFQSILFFGGCIYMVCPWLWMTVVWGVLGKLFRCAVVWAGALQCWEMNKEMLLGIELKATMPNYLSIQLTKKNSLPLAEWTREPVSTSYSQYISKPTNLKAESYTPQANFYLKGYYGGPPRLKLRRTTWVWHFVPGFPTTSTTCQNTRVKQGPTRKTLMWFIGR